MGNTKFLVQLIDEYPDLIWKRNDDGQTIFHIAAFHRHESIYSLLYEIGSMKDTVTQIRDKEGNNILHSVAMNSGKNPQDNVWGAAYQMRHELLWFKEVSLMVPPQSKDMKNAQGLTPSELFTNNHKALALEGEALIKGTIGQSMVAATLISTIGFSVVFTIPGGYNQNNGFPIFLQNKVFTLFIILDAISFLLSSFSIITFLTIMVTSYGQNDFVETLPQNLLLGQATLLLSIFTTMVAFIASFFVLYHNSLSIVIALLATIPAVLLSKQQYHVAAKVSRLYKPWHHFHPNLRHMLHYQNPRF
ncbi:putative ankyrin repeat-containing domain, PGG domain, ankyrin repeat-containing domain superfamily [Helianthus debilis subsp. tardiflorus]